MLVGKNRVIRRRAVIGLLLAASLTLLTLSFRQGSEGVIGAIQRGALSITAPFSEATTRVTQPFADAWNWSRGLVDARSENERLKEQLERTGAAVVAAQAAEDDNARLTQLLNFTESGSKLASQYDFVGGTVIRQPQNAYSQTVTLDIGSSSGVRENDPVVAPAPGSDLFVGLIGRVKIVSPNSCTVELILSRDAGVSARLLHSSVRGTAVPSQGDPGVLNLLSIGQDAVVSIDQIAVTSGGSQALRSLYPAGIPIGQVTGVSQSDVEAPNKTVQVTPFVDFGDISRVLVLQVGR
ncbi:MAG: rod shape-determining protein MreC [Gaiellales bacterium]|nr:rod shape-determining protein MreC [Gaiellales bacterium]